MSAALDTRSELPLPSFHAERDHSPEGAPGTTAPAVVDPITVEVIGSALASIVEEMGEALVRASYSTNIKERRDCSTALFDIQGNTLCVDWAGDNRRFSGCYAVEAQQGNHVRLVGPARWEGTLDR